MTCAEFQKVLPYIVDTGGNADEEAHLKSCPVCSDLVADLKYIAEQAKLLVPMVDPSPRVWAGIQSSLEREGLVRPAGTARFPTPVMPGRWASGYRLLGFAALLLIAIGLITYHRGSRPATTESTNISSPAPAKVKPAGVDEEDTKLLQQVSQHAPAMRATYEDNLKSVNQYIADAEQAVAQDPDSEEAHDHLISAYGQKAMLYQMALARSLE